VAHWSEFVDASGSPAWYNNITGETVNSRPFVFSAVADAWCNAELRCMRAEVGCAVQHYAVQCLQCAVVRVPCLGPALSVCPESVYPTLQALVRLGCCVWATHRNRTRGG
jgi:hypothetical protein